MIKMSEKVSRTMSGAGALAPSKPVPMKLFATWEVDRTPSNCIPRWVLVRFLRGDGVTLPGIDMVSVSKKNCVGC